MRVSAGGYHAWRKRLSKPPSVRRQTTRRLIEQCFWDNRRRYGTRRIAAELQRAGAQIGRSAVRTVLREANLRALRPKKFAPRTTDSAHGKLASPNLLAAKENQPVRAAQVIIGDITYLPLCGGQWCYLAVWQDKFTRRVVGWAVSDRMTDQLVIRAFDTATRAGLIAPNAIIHTDRGSQYVSGDFRARLAAHKIRQSMSGRGNCYDNAQAESWFARFKTELVENGVFASVEDARSETFSYIEGYYNRKRLHSGLGMKTPLEFEAELKKKHRQRKASLESTFS